MKIVGTSLEMKDGKWSVLKDMEVVAEGTERLYVVSADIGSIDLSSEDGSLTVSIRRSGDEYE